MRTDIVEPQVASETVPNQHLEGHQRRAIVQLHASLTGRLSLGRRAGFEVREIPFRASFLEVDLRFVSQPSPRLAEIRFVRGDLARPGIGEDSYARILAAAVASGRRSWLDTACHTLTGAERSLVASRY